MKRDHSMNPARIALGERDRETFIEPEDVYFSFASGRLAYDCVSCNAKCCRGFGYLVTGSKEVALQIEMRRQLPLFVATSGNQRSRPGFRGELSARMLLPQCEWPL
jgi:hypothetical protein